MIAVAALLAMSAGAVAVAAPGPGALPRSRPRVAIPDLQVRVSLDRSGRTLALSDGRTASGERRAAPPCPPELCSAVVEVPGLSIKVARPSRTELVATLLDRTGLEPFATIAWAFVASGLRVDWSPPAFDAGDPAAAVGGGWGRVFVRVRLRLDAMNRPAVPRRHKERQQRSWAALMGPQP